MKYAGLLLSALGTSCTVAFGWDPATLPAASARQDAAMEAPVDATTDAAMEAPVDATTDATTDSTADPDAHDATSACDGPAGPRPPCGPSCRVCPEAQVCQGGECVPACRAFLSPCMGMCVEFQTNPRHCGGCGVECNVGAPRCCRGVCVARCI
jgi:hypothetical protein